MTTIWEDMVTALTPLALPMADSVYVVDSGQQLPDSYLVYFVISEPPAQHADDSETHKSYHVQVSYYSRNGLINMPDIVGALILAGFTRVSGHELPYNLNTRHFGYALEFNYLE
jgi:hypothetical protein